MTSLPASSYLTPSLQSTQYYRTIDKLINQCIAADLSDDSIRALIDGIKAGHSLTENSQCDPQCKHTVNIQILHKLLVPINTKRNMRGNSVIIPSRASTPLHDKALADDDKLADKTRSKYELLSDDDTKVSDDSKSSRDDICDDQIEIIEAVGFDILDDILPYLFHANITIQKYAHDLVQLICTHGRCSELFLVFVAYLERNNQLQTSFVLFPYVERLLQRTTNHRRADMLEQLFGVIMLIWRNMVNHEDEISVRFVVSLADTMDSLTASLCRLEGDEEAYEREQNILLTVVLRCSQWLMAEHWSTLVQATKAGQVKLKRYSSQEQNEAAQRQYQQLLVERVPSIVRCVINCGQLPVVLASLHDSMPPSINEPVSDSTSTSPHESPAISAPPTPRGTRPDIRRTRSVDYGMWSMPGIAAVIAIALATNNFQDSMGHVNSGVRTKLLIAIDQARCDYPSPPLPQNRAVLYLQCYPLLVVLLADMHRHPAYLPLCVHLWSLLQHEIPTGSLSEQYLQPHPEVHGRSVWLYFELAVNCIVQIRSKKNVVEFVKLLKQMISLFEPAAKFELLERALTNVPYSNVTALLLTELKEQIHQATVKKSGSQYNLKYGQQMSVYTSEAVPNILAVVLQRCKTNIEMQTDALIGALNIVKYIVMKQKAKPVPSLVATTTRIISKVPAYYTENISWVHDAVATAVKSLQVDADDADESQIGQLQLADSLHDELRDMMQTY